MNADLSPAERVALRVFLDESAELIRKAIREKNVSGFGPPNASGRTAASVEVVDTAKGGQVLADKALQYIIYGRGPGKFPPVQAIRDWIRDKGIKTDLPVNSLAFLIARKIANEGSATYRKYKGQDSGLLSEAMDDSRFDMFMDKLGDDLEVRFMSGIIRRFAP
jgi:hypothetical protein